MHSKVNRIFSITAGFLLKGAICYLKLSNNPISNSTGFKSNVSNHLHNNTYEKSLIILCLPVLKLLMFESVTRQLWRRMPDRAQLVTL